MSSPVSNGFVLVSLLLILGCSVHAQSGRRLPRSQPTAPGSVSTSSPETETSPNVAAEPIGRKLSEQVNLLVGRHLTSKHLISEDTIYTSFIRRLNQFTKVSVTPIGDVNRQQAITRARKEKDALVILLQFEIDSIQGRKVVLNSADLQVKYFVFAPSTGKVITKGTVYYQAIGGGGTRRSNWPGGTPIKLTAEAAGIETAERLHDWLLLNI